MQGDGESLAYQQVVRDVEWKVRVCTARHDEHGRAVHREGTKVEAEITHRLPQPDLVIFRAPHVDGAEAPRVAQKRLSVLLSLDERELRRCRLLHQRVERGWVRSRQSPRTVRRCGVVRADADAGEGRWRHQHHGQQPSPTSTLLEGGEGGEELQANEASHRMRRHMEALRGPK